VACATLSVLCLALGNRRAHDVVLWWPAIMATTLAMMGLAHGVCRRRPATPSDVAGDPAAQPPDTVVVFGRSVPQKG